LKFKLVYDLRFNFQNRIGIAEATYEASGRKRRRFCGQSDWSLRMLNMRCSNDICVIVITRRHVGGTDYANTYRVKCGNLTFFMQKLFAERAFCTLYNSHESFRALIYVYDVTVT